MSRLGPCDGLSWLVFMVAVDGDHEFEFCETEREAREVAEQWLAASSPREVSDVFVARVRAQGTPDQTCSCAEPTVTVERPQPCRVCGGTVPDDGELECAS